MSKVGFTDSTITLQTATRLGSRRIIEIYGATQEKLQTEYKAEAGMTPRTIADIQSGNIGKSIIKRYLPGIYINEEETGITEGRDLADKAYFDPLDGTSSFARKQRYSTSGAALFDVSGNFKAAAICHTFEKELLVSEKGKGAFLFSLDENLIIIGESKRLEVLQDKSLKGGIVYVDALFNEKTSPPKLEFMKELVTL